MGANILGPKEGKHNVTTDIAKPSAEHVRVPKPPLGTKALFRANITSAGDDGDSIVVNYQDMDSTGKGGSITVRKAQVNPAVLKSLSALQGGNLLVYSQNGKEVDGVDLSLKGVTEIVPLLQPGVPTLSGGKYKVLVSTNG